LIGPVQQKNGIKAHTFHICDHEYLDDDLHEIVKRSFTTEAFGVNLNCSKANKDEARAQEIMEKTARRVGDRFEIDDIILPENKMQCDDWNVLKEEWYKTEIFVNNTARKFKTTSTMVMHASFLLMKPLSKILDAGTFLCSKHQQTQQITSKNEKFKIINRVENMSI
jgi:hypothetical protein